MANGPNSATNGNGANIGFERELWRAADALRSNMDAAEYKHVVLGLIFLKYISPGLFTSSVNSPHRVIFLVG